MRVALDFVNMAESVPQTVALFQMNTAPDFSMPLVPWKVIRHCGVYCNHPFVYETSLELSINDCFGNYTPRITISGEEVYRVVDSHLGMRLERSSRNWKEETEVFNDKQRGTVGANLFRSGRLVATWQHLIPQQSAFFALKPILYIDVNSKAKEGVPLQEMKPTHKMTPLHLAGLTKARIIMRGGGMGSDAMPYSFHLE